MAKIVAGQLREATSWNKLTHENHLFNAFGGEPQYLRNVIGSILDVNNGASFVRWSQQFPVETVDRYQPFRWKLKGSNRRNIPLVAAWMDELGTVPVSASTKAGYGHSEFYMDFPEDHFSTTEVIYGEKRDLYHLRIMGDSIALSNGTRYRVKLVTGDSSLFVPSVELTRNKRWVGGYALSEKYGSKTAADISFSTPFDMQERVSFSRQRHEIFGEMIDEGKNQPLMTYLIGEDGKPFLTWMSAMEYEYLQKFDERLAYLTFYGKSPINDLGESTLKGESGNVIEAGNGMREQFSPSNRYFYNTLTLKQLTRTALDATVGKVARDNRTMVIGTGEYGLMDLHEMCAHDLNSSDYKWAGDSTGRAYSWGGVNGNEINAKFGQIVGVATINGVNFKFVHFPHYDDPVQNILEHPEGGVAESRRMTIMDYGTAKDPNIVQIKIKGRQPVYNIVPGMRDPYQKAGGGINKPRIAASEVDGYVMNTADWRGAAVIDPRRTIEFIPNLLR